MNTSQQPFEQRVLETTCAAINRESAAYLDTFKKTQSTDQSIVELDYQYKDYAVATAAQKSGWFFLLAVLMPALGIFDYTSIAPFISYLVASAGGFIGAIIGLTGWLFFTMLELATGWVLVYFSKGKPIVKAIAIALAIGLIVTPSYLIYTTYDLSANKTAGLYSRTVALIIVSIIIHTIFFVVVAEVWKGIFYYTYRIRRKILLAKSPEQQMKVQRKSLQEHYSTFSGYASVVPPLQQATMLNNLSWYIKIKITNSLEPYDLSDFNPSINYAPALPHTSKSQTTKPNKTV